MLMFTVKDFIEKTILSDRKKGTEIPDQLGKILQKEQNSSEYRSWQNSYYALAEVLSSVVQECNVLNNLLIILEHKLDPSPFRCDVILAGKENGRDKLLIIELKQWSNGYITERTGNDLVSKDGILEHPYLQAQSYKDFLEKIYTIIETNKIHVDSCAFLHNYEFSSGDILLQIYEDILKDSDECKAIKIFGKSTRQDITDLQSATLKQFILNSFNDAPSQITEADLEKCQKKPLPSFVENIHNLLEGKPIFKPTEEQKRVQANILSLLNHDESRHHVFVVQGGPGTGKTVLAFNLLVDIASRAEGMVTYATKNSQLVKSYLHFLQKDDLDVPIPTLKNRLLSTLFSEIRPVFESPEHYDCLIIDEAQRLQQRFQCNGEWQDDAISQLVCKAKNIIFLLDEDQKLAFNDILFFERIDALKSTHKVTGVEIFPQNAKEANNFSLFQEYRTFGSTTHLNWIDRFLGYDRAQNLECALASGYKMQVVQTPEDLFQIIREHELNGKHARVLGGLCWLWKAENRKKKVSPDICISGQNVSYYWNSSSSDHWSVDPDTLNEVGCVHTVLGQEFEYVGVIIGKDLIYQDGRVKTNPDMNTQFMRYANDTQRVNGMALWDKDRKTVIPLSKSKEHDKYSEAEELVRNHYHILLTRGRRGCFIYCEDQALQQFLCKQLNQKKPREHGRLYGTIDRIHSKNGTAQLLSEDGIKYGVGSFYFANLFKAGIKEGSAVSFKAILTKNGLYASDILIED